MKSRRRLRRATALVALTLCALSAGCGVPIDSASHTISTRLPSALLDKPGNSTTTTLPPTHGELAVTVFLLSQESLVPVTRVVPSGETTTVDEKLQVALADLELGPTTTEILSGLTTSVPPYNVSAPLRLLSVTPKRITVSLNSSFFELLDPQLFQAYAQIVFTVTQFDNTVPVSFLLDGNQSAVLPSGALDTQPVTREDYHSLVSTISVSPRPPATTPKSSGAKKTGGTLPKR